MSSAEGVSAAGGRGQSAPLPLLPRHEEDRESTGVGGSPAAERVSTAVVRVQSAARSCKARREVKSARSHKIDPMAVGCSSSDLLGAAGSTSMAATCSGSGGSAALLAGGVMDAGGSDKDAVRLCANGVSSNAENIDGASAVGEQALRAGRRQSIVERAVSTGWGGLKLSLPPVSEWWRSAAAAPARMDMVAKACSIVLWGWTDGIPVPAEALALLASEVEPPAAVEQAKEVFELEQAQRQLEEARATRDRQLPDTDRRAAAQLHVDRVIRRVEDLLEKHSGVHSATGSNDGKKRWGAVAKKMTGQHGRLLPICFVTFRSSGAARRALGKETISMLETLGVHAGPAPRPTDIEWTHLHKKSNPRLLSLYDLATVIVMVPAIGMAIIVAMAFAQMCLFWVPMNCIFAGWCPAQKWYGGLSWIWGEMPSS